jgi:transcriptional regulator
MRTSRLANVVTATEAGLHASAIPLVLDESDGPFGTLYGHVARPNIQWELPPQGDALAIFMGPDAYVTPSWYASKREHGKVVPTWNYTAVHAHGPIEFFEDEDRLLDVVTRLTNLHESSRPESWAVTDAPERFIKAQLRGIVGLRMTIVRLEAKQKMGQNRSAADRQGVATGLGQSEREGDRRVAAMIPTDPS